MNNDGMNHIQLNMKKEGYRRKRRVPLKNQAFYSLSQMPKSDSIHNGVLNSK